MIGQELAEHLIAEEGYRAALVLDCNTTGYGNRFCFEDKALADKRFAELVSDEDVPEGFIARR